MVKKAWIVVIGCLLVGLAGCGKGNSQDQKEYEEIIAHFQEKLNSADYNVQLTIYKSSGDETILFVETVNNRLHHIQRFLWDIEKKEQYYLQSGTMEEQDYKEKYMEQGEKVFETTIDYDNKEETSD